MIRPMRTEDIPEVALLERDIYPQPWSVRIFYDELSRGDRRYYVAEIDGDGGPVVAGYGGLMLVEEDAHITNLAVAPHARKQRLGTRLMLQLVRVALDAEVRHLTLEVRVSNVAARELYRRFGFAPVGLRKHYYRDEDALIMWAIDVDEPEYGERLAAIEESLA